MLNVETCDKLRLFVYKQNSVNITEQSLASVSYDNNKHPHVHTKVLSIPLFYLEKHREKHYSPTLSTLTLAALQYKFPIYIQQDDSDDENIDDDDDDGDEDKQDDNLSYTHDNLMSTKQVQWLFDQESYYKFLWF